MKARRLHRILGIFLLLPFIGWAVTGVVFFVKPGYADAYAQLQPRTYPLQDEIGIQVQDNWLELRYVRTVLGLHVLVRTRDGWQQLEPATLRSRPLPDSNAIERLLVDAFVVDPERYGKISSVSGSTATTDTGVRLDLDWNRLSFRQQGKDTRRIDTLYRIHYLQWTGIKSVDRIFGIAGLLLLLAMTALGGRLAFASRRH